MPDRHAHRRAGVYRHRAQQLTEAARHEWRYASYRQHMLDLAATYQRAADALAPPALSHGEGAQRLGLHDSVPTLAKTASFLAGNRKTRLGGVL